MLARHEYERRAASACAVYEKSFNRERDLFYLLIIYEIVRSISIGAVVERMRARICTLSLKSALSVVTYHFLIKACVDFAVIRKCFY
jgi:hypothetical protein